VSDRRVRWLAPLALAVIVLIAYGNSTRGRFHLDDWHTIEQNPAIRSVAPDRLARFFTDISAFSVLPRNLDYRPLLLVTYAGNYALSKVIHGDGYDPRTWHWLNIALHALSCISLFFIGRALLGARGLSRLDSLDPPRADLVCFAAAALFAVHPVTSGAVNYISARSSLMTAALLLPALAIYLRIMSGRLGPAWIAAVAALYAMAILTKIEAVAFLGVLAVAELTLNPAFRGRALAERLRGIPGLLRTSWARAAVVLVVSVMLAGLWSRMSTLATNPHKAHDGMNGGVYLLTQVRAWWLYIAQILAPTNIVFDPTDFPISGQATAAQTAAGLPTFSIARAILEPRVWLALTGALALLRRAPLVPFLVAAFIIFLSPSSSIVPLAEMVNEHRPYLPDAGLFILGAVALWQLLCAVQTDPRRAFPVVAAALAIPLLALTMQRNLIFRSGLTLWGDTAMRSPESARAQMNYGLALMDRADYDAAIDRFRRGLAVWPYYHYLHTNLGIALAAKGDAAAARASHDRAVELTKDESGPLYWRGRYFAQQGDTQAAIGDFRAAIERNATDFRAAAGLVACLARAGSADEAEAIAARHSGPDPAGFAAARAEIERLFPDQSSTSVNDEGVELMARNRLDEAATLFRRAIQIDPANHLPHTNMGILHAARGNHTEAVASFNRAAELAPRHSSPFYWRGRYKAQQRDLAAAIPDLAAACERSSFAPRDAAALAECLNRAGRKQEADAISAAAKSPDFEAERAAFARIVFGQP
jgi:protein O-mannosyl-transferase